MNFNQYTTEKLKQLSALIDLLLESPYIFDKQNPYQEVSFNLKEKITIFRDAHMHDGFPAKHCTNTRDYFNYIHLLEELDRGGSIEIDKGNVGFLDWIIKTDLWTMLNLKNKVDARIKGIEEQANSNNFESCIRDKLNNNQTLLFSVIPSGKFKLPPCSSFKQETIDGTQCDIVGRDCNNEIVLFVEITKGSLERDDLRKFEERHLLAPNAIQWFICSRINRGINEKISANSQVRISKISQFLEDYPTLFRDIIQIK
jgi:hypothetical protein